MTLPCERPRDGLVASYAACRRVSRAAASTFYPSFYLLPRMKRRAMEAIYAFMRHSDDLADSTAPNDDRRAALRAWRAACEAALHGAAAEIRATPAAGRHPAALEVRTDLLPAVADVVRRYRIPPEHLLAVIDGVEMDLDATAYATFDELRIYCERVASAVGLACIHIWGFRNPEAYEPARCCGIALQLTNILRDVKEDAAWGRVYLPAADIAAAGYDVERLRAGVADAAFQQLVAREVARAKDFYRRGAQLGGYLEPEGRRILGLILEVYRRLLERIERRPCELLAGGVRLPKSAKLWLAARWAVGWGQK